MTLLNLPDDVLDKILSFISYDEVSRNRLVCRRLNNVCKRVLNRGFHKVERYHAQCLRQVKSQLPRRESERRKHHLARHCDILTAVETRLSLLGMTFMKFIELNMCCFIPGKVLDEIYKVLRYVATEQSPARAHEILQELRDLSSMAMEHFEEKISPHFKKNRDADPRIVNGVNFHSITYHRPENSTSLRFSEEYKLNRFTEKRRQIVTSRQGETSREIHSLKKKFNEVQKINKSLEKRVLELQNLLSAQIEKMKEQDLKIDQIVRSMPGRMKAAFLSKPSLKSDVQLSVPAISSREISINDFTAKEKIDINTSMLNVGLVCDVVEDIKGKVIETCVEDNSTNALVGCEKVGSEFNFSVNVQLNQKNVINELDCKGKSHKRQSQRVRKKQRKE